MIVKLQQGGGLPPYQYYRPVTVTTPSGTVAQPERATRASGASNKSNDLTDKDILKSLDKIDGLPSDMTVLQSGLISALNSDSGFSLFGSSDSLFGSTSQIASQYANTLLGIKIANFSKKKYDEIKKTLDQNGGLNEIAVTDSGGVLVSDSEGKVSQISIDKYLQNKSRYKALTNSNILYIFTKAWFHHAFSYFCVSIYSTNYNQRKWFSDNNPCLYGKKSLFLHNDFPKH